MADDDPYFVQIRREAEDVLLTEPELAPLLYSTVLSGGVRSFEDAVAATVCYRLLLQDKICGEQYQHGQLRQQEIEGGDDDDDFGGAGSSSSPPSKGGGRQQQRRRQSSLLFTPNSCQSLIRRAFDSDLLELGHTMGEAVRDDVAAVVERDPAMDTYLEVVLFSKGFAALVCHRAAHRLWVPPHRQQEQLQHSSQPMPNKKFTALYLQSQASALFGVDLHPLARFGSGILLDHGTGIVVGETAAVGDGCTILHGVTLGGTGKDHGDRHPKVGKHVLIGAGSSILGNIQVGDSAKIGAGSVVLRSIPPFATAVGAPAKIIGRTVEADPAHDVDLGLLHVENLKDPSSSGSTGPPTSSDEGGDSDADERDEDIRDVDVVNLTSNPEGKCRTRLFKKKYSDFYSICPYREYRALARRAPAGSVNLLTLSSHLKPLGVTSCEIGASMFELDTDGVGYRRWDDDGDGGAVRDHLVDVLSRCTRLSPDDISAAVSRIRKQATDASRPGASVDAGGEARRSGGAGARKPAIGSASADRSRKLADEPTSPRGAFLSRFALFRGSFRSKA